MTVDRIREFRRSLQRAAAERVVETTHGSGVLMDSWPQVYDRNFLLVDASPAGAAELAAEADGVLEHCHHRRVVVERGRPGLETEFAELAFERSTHLVLAHEREPDRRVDTAAIREVTFDDIAPARRAATLGEPWGDDEIAAQLEGAARRIAKAVPTRYFAAVVDGEIAGWCELYARGGVIQIENVEVVETFRGRGLGRAIVQHALDQAQRVADVVFLEAFADDWPRELYARLGFTCVDRVDYYTRLPTPLTRLRLRTPRLELRLPTVAETRDLFRVASAGIHDPAHMPFAIPWTDSLDEAAFLAYHAARRELVAFLEGKPVGAQGLEVDLPAVQTASWLGRAFQGKGLGTEMRAAVLTLAFDHLGATLARSGAIEGNDQSLGVSRKLGYAVVGSRTLAPRGTPVEHTDLELRREDFVSPVPVELAGVPQALAQLIA